MPEASARIALSAKAWCHGNQLAPGAQQHTTHLLQQSRELGVGWTHRYLRLWHVAQPTSCQQQSACGAACAVEAVPRRWSWRTPWKTSVTACAYSATHKQRQICDEHGMQRHKRYTTYWGIPRLRVGSGTSSVVAEDDACSNGWFSTRNSPHPPSRATQPARPTYACTVPHTQAWPPFPQKLPLW